MNKNIISTSLLVNDRLDAFYYRKDFIDIENKIKNKTSKTIKDYIVSMAGGATPSKEEGSKYYTEDKRTGIPFFRVQNVSESGLNLENCVYINSQTHETLLKRSKVFQGDLLTKITGVGRMAISAVVPNGIEGNINQHLVVIKTNNPMISRTLATYLNLDIVEKLASRRSTGGTRPALDYEALKSIPVIYNEKIVQIMDKAYQLKTEKEQQAKDIIKNIDTYLLDELGIVFTEEKNKTGKKYIIKSSEFINNRFDTNYNNPCFLNLEKALSSSKYPLYPLTNILDKPLKGIEVGSNNYVLEGIPFIRVTDIKNNEIDINTDKKISLDLFQKLKKDYQPQIGEILFTKDGTVGISAIIKEHIEGIISGGIIRLKVLKEHNPRFIQTYLSLSPIRALIERESIGAIIQHLSVDKLMMLKIPCPPLEIQNKIAIEIEELLNKVTRFKEEAEQIVKTAKQQAEALILGE